MVAAEKTNPSTNSSNLTDIKRLKKTESISTIKQKRGYKQRAGEVAKDMRATTTRYAHDDVRGNTHAYMR